MKKAFTTITLLLIYVIANAYAHIWPRMPEHFILGGELGNSSASSKEDIQSFFPQLKEMGLNTVLMPVYWELLEPEEGKFDYTLIEEALKSAKDNDLKLVLLWFGSWKNSMSCYAPGWIKKDTKRFPRAVTEKGKPLEIVSAFNKDALKADLTAFNALLDYLSTHDNDKTVIMIQIENEIGMLESARDHSHLAEKEYSKGVPKELTEILEVPSHTPWKDLNMELDYSDEIFMAWNYAKYVETLAQSARKKLPSVILYVNAAMDSRGRRPGQYPSAGPIARLSKVWKKGAPSIDHVAPDLYDAPFKPWMKQYSQIDDNWLFIPEIRRSTDNGAQALYAFGEHRAIGFSPFSIENASSEEAYRLKEAYDLIKKLERHIKNNVSYGVLFESENAKDPITIDAILGNSKIVVSHYFTLPWDSRATDGSVWPNGGGIILDRGMDDYLIAGTGIVVKWESEDETSTEKKLGEDGFLLSGEDAKDNEWNGKERIGILSCDEVDINPDGSLKVIRRLNGDETHQGRHVRIGVDDYKILRVKLYRY